MKVSIIVPAYNEEGNIEVLYEKLRRVMEEGWEVILVDDGSTDGTYQEIERVKKEDPRVKSVHLPINSGKSVALKEGFLKSEGEIIVTMDADLQDDPEEIPRVIEEIEKGADIVCGWRFARKDPFWKRFPSRIFNFFVSWWGRLRIHDINCGLKAFRREVIENIEFYGDLYRFLPLIASWKGFTVTEVKVKHHPRRKGKSKYGWKKFYSGFLDFLTIMFLTHYRVKPLHLFGSIGLILLLPGSGIEIGLALRWFLSYPHSVGGHYPLLWLGILLIIVGIQFISLGLLAEMITYGFMQRRGR